MSKFPNLGPEEKRPGEFSRVERSEDFVGMGQGIEKIIQVFGEFGNVIDKIVVTTEPAVGSIDMINKRMDEMRAKFGVQVTHIEAFNDSMDNLQRALSVRTLEEGMANATDSVANFNKVLELMQQNLDANVVTAKVGRLSALEKELTELDIAEKQKKRDKERDKSILGISGAAIALKAFNKVIEPFRQGLASLEAGFKKNTTIVFDAFENLGEVIGRSFLPIFEDWSEGINDVTAELASQQDDVNTFANILGELELLFAENAELAELFEDRFTEIKT